MIPSGSVAIWALRLASSPGNLAIFATFRRASSLVGGLATDLRPQPMAAMKSARLAVTLAPELEPFFLANIALR
jgi:hypothetical protein